jgi:hypothetical protein
MKIFRIGGNKVYNDPIIGLRHFATIDLAKKFLIKNGFYREVRKFKDFPYSSNVWYNKPLTEDGYPIDDTSYRTIEEIDVIES